LNARQFGEVLEQDPSTELGHQSKLARAGRGRVSDRIGKVLGPAAERGFDDRPTHLDLGARGFLRHFCKHHVIDRVSPNGHQHPFGIGPLQFYLYFAEGPHNSFLNAFMSGGWLAGFGYFSLSLVTTATSTRFLFTRTPWQPIYHALYAAYLGTVAESVSSTSITGATIS
jgi:hypothetical protein